MLPAIQDHARESQIVPRRAVKPAATGLKLWFLRDFEGNDGKRAIRAAPMHRRQPRPLIRAQLEGCIHHAERLENHPRQMRAKRLACCGLDHLAGPIYADAITPILAWIE